MSQLQPSLAAAIPEGEVHRKLLHTTPGLLPFFLVQYPHPDPLDAVALAVVTVIAVVLTALFLACHRTVRRKDEHNFVTNTLSYSATILTTLIMFPGHAEFAGVVVCVLAFGDTSAFIGGRLFGKRPLPWNSRKTCIGTLCFLVGAAPLATLAYWAEARPAMPLGVAVICGSVAALAGAAAESLPTRISDNFRVGLASATAVIVAHFAAIQWLGP